MNKKGVDFMKKKIFAIVVFCVFCFVSFLSIFLEILSLLIEAPNEHSFLWNVYKFMFSIPVHIIQLLTLACCVVVAIFIVIKGSNASNFVRYTYEEYKQYREKKKVEKQAQKKAKLQEKLQEIEKTE